MVLDFFYMREDTVTISIRSKEEIYMVEFGEQLRRIRESKGMTQQTLAEYLYVTRQTVSRWECGVSQS
jgi:DNA-binding transcriptional regulator YiaG